MTKKTLRQQAYALRNAQQDKKALSFSICEKFINLSFCKKASTIMCYLHCRSEVQTQAFVQELLMQQQRVVIPYCTQDEKGNNKLGLWHLQDFNELNKGTWGILEPPKSRWNEKAKNVMPQELDVIMVPGVAFSRHGARLGNGAGYYDRLLNTVRDDCILIGVCYESQLFDEIPMETYDVYMDFVLTEKQLYPRHLHLSHSQEATNSKEL